MRVATSCTRSGRPAPGRSCRRVAQAHEGPDPCGGEPDPLQHLTASRPGRVELCEPAVIALTEERQHQRLFSSACRGSSAPCRGRRSPPTLSAPVATAPLVLRTYRTDLMQGAVCNTISFLR